MNPEPNPSTEANHWKPNPELKKGERTLDALAKSLRSSYLTLAFQAEGQEFAIDVRRLSEAELEEARKFTAEIVPPIKNAAAEAIIDKYDLESPDYVKLMTEARTRQAATIINYAVKGGIPGGSTDERVKWLGEHLPLNVQMLITGKVIGISSDNTIEMASFF